MSSMDRVVNVGDLERSARRRLPRAVFDAVSGAAGDELTMRENCAAYNRIHLLPRVLDVVGPIDLGIELLGRRVASPVILAPVGHQQLVHPDAEAAVARAAAAAGIVYVLPTASHERIEQVADFSGPRWFQLYQSPAEQAADHMVDRAQSAGYDALCLTLDTTARGFRERDARNRFSDPLHVGPRMLLDAIRHPHWAVESVRSGAARRQWSTGAASVSGAARRATHSPMRPVTWTDLAQWRERWTAPLVVKGVLRADQCDRLVDAGVDGIVVSNHGGRLLDTVPATVDVLAHVVDAVAGRVPVFVDGGIRRGTDVVKALSLGATACLVGRPLLWALAAGGETGVRTLIDLLHDEILRTMRFLGTRRPADLDRACLARAAPPRGIGSLMPSTWSVG